MSDSYDSTRIETFDDFDESGASVDVGEVVPFQFNKELDAHEWLVNFWDVSKEKSRSRIKHYRRNLFLYKGVHWRGETSSKRAPKQVVNFINEMIDSKVSNRSKNKVSFQAIPTEYTQEAINAAKGIKKMLRARCNQIGFDKKNRDLDRIMFIFGHAFFLVDWDNRAGGLHPKYSKIKELGGKAYSKIQKKLGTEAIFNGDVSVSLLGPNRIFPEMNRETGIGTDGDVDYVDIVEMVHIEELKAQYPDCDIQADGHEDFFWRMGDSNTYTNYVVKHRFLHRVTPYSEGKEIVWCRSGILEEKSLSYEIGELPLVESRDSDIYEEYFGRSDIENTYGMQRFYNAIQSFQARDVSMASAPKWLIPKGSVKPTSVNNDLTTMEYTGAVPPRLETFKATPDQGFVIQDRLENKIGKAMKAFDMSRGEVPTGITATSALRLIEQTEQNVSLNGVLNRKKRIIDALNMVANFMAQYYKPDDERTIRALGEKNDYMIEDVKDIDFSKFYGVEIEKTSSLSESKAGRISDIVELNQVTQTDPVFKKPEIIEILGLGLDSAYRSRATIGINAARTILDKIIKGHPVPEPEKYDDLIVHRGVLLDALQELAYNSYMTQETIGVIKTRVVTIEYLMDERSRENLKFAQDLSVVDDYPMYFKPHLSLGDLIRMHMGGGSFQNQKQPVQETDHIETNITEETV